ncbi:protein SCO1/2 [Polaribacter dokdonensis DSW-5]|uniref:Protein SCO1/2 n=1 Tax=Polaribacter dokdonensis DSW-5 TaxID=1300348 RepID=A0A1H5JSZ7_9FLAO|nr:protein SCO1/2 [Polaribacter dokdonensis DSW-5]
MKSVKKYSLLVLTFFMFLQCKKQESKELESRVDDLPYYNEASFTPKWIDKNSNKLKDFHKIPKFEFINQNGKIVSDKTFDNKIYVTDFFFTTCPGICPIMTKNMHMIQEAFQNDNSILMLSHSVTPTKDSVPQLKKYAIEKNIGANWHLVTGKKQEIYDLGRSSYFVENDLGEPKGIDDFLHTENFILIDKNKHIRGIYNGLNKNSVKQLIADIKTLQKS